MATDCPISLATFQAFRQQLSSLDPKRGQNTTKQKHKRLDISGWPRSYLLCLSKKGWCVTLSAAPCGLPKGQSSIVCVSDKLYFSQGMWPKPTTPRAESAKQWHMPCTTAPVLLLLEKPPWSCRYAQAWLSHAMQITSIQGPAHALLHRDAFVGPPAEEE